MKKYQGSCHCGKVRFELEADLDHIRVCDCSICRRRGALIHRVPEQNLHIFTPLEELTIYEWGRKTAKDFFCPICGVLPFRIPGDPTDKELENGVKRFAGWAVNVRCLEGVNLFQIPVKEIQGSVL